MVTIYLCFLAGGAVLPFLSVILGSLGGGSDVDADIGVDTDLDLDTDFDTDFDTDLDADAVMGSATDGLELDTGSGLSVGLLPTSLMSLSALAIMFGAVGSIMTMIGRGTILTFVVAAITGYIAAVIVQTIIKTLKKIQKRNYGINENELLMYDGKVVETILPGQLGTVSFNTLKDVHVSYPSRCSDEKLRLETGRIVKALEVNNGIFIVEPKNKYE
ncbi:MAG: hypothetical protein K0R34_4314 [Herbinix sp.]|jgi:hypothetical protein|nr:hypothetical protein [Herbinix sp.]